MTLEGRGEGLNSLCQNDINYSKNSLDKLIHCTQYGISPLEVVPANQEMSGMSKVGGHRSTKHM